MNKKLVLASGLALVLGAAGVAYWQFSGAQAQATFRLAKVERGNLVAAVSATGTLNPVVSVQVGSQVSGQIKEILVDYNSVVKQGDVIARIDPESFALRVNQAMADLEAGRATALTQRANVAALQAEVSRAEVALGEAERALKRNQMLVEKGFVSQAALETSQSAVATARELVKTAQAQRAVGDAQVRNGEALVKQRESQLSQARVDLERTTIRAPVDGVVISRSVDAGQTVAASLQAPTLFLIARNLTDMQVEASIDESEIGRIAVGQEATFTVDSFPGRTFRGKITQVRKAALVVQNVVTYVAIISAPNPDLTLLPGMTTNVRITVASRDNVLRVPNAALRYRPPGAAATKGQKGSKGQPADGEKGAAPKGASGGNAAQGQATRERLTRELDLNAEQQAKLEAIFRASGEKIAAISTDDPAQRKKEIGRLRALARVEIAAILNDEQRARYQAMAPAERGGGAATRGTVWLSDGNRTPKSVSLRLGITDGSYTEVLGGDLKEGDAVITGADGAGASRKDAKGSTPRFGF
ncbi:MAG: efflux RND transporter periplasmic adaptor subunit [Betaproteobacteria bacterium]|nr:efflux RND transporter periplasmic adaptor subunit [Betaproteobacteria bacterium]MDH4293798.1 efflux RND transporter periplasmic adaptor subunit [Betaproteobacteria bacterium]MDH5343173.1 efflux RND transporter periplasmic adaptor subunit [Betaproteobacteria bacterium]